MDEIKVLVKFPRCLTAGAFVVFSCFALLALILCSLDIFRGVARLSMSHTIILVVTAVVTSSLATVICCFNVASAREIARLALQLTVERERKLKDELNKTPKENGSIPSANADESRHSIKLDLSMTS